MTVSSGRQALTWCQAPRRKVRVRRLHFTQRRCRLGRLPRQKRLVQARHSTRSYPSTGVMQTVTSDTHVPVPHTSDGQVWMSFPQLHLHVRAWPPGIKSVPAFLRLPHTGQDVQLTLANKVLQCSVVCQARGVDLMSI